MIGYFRTNKLFKEKHVVRGVSSTTSTTKKCRKIKKIKLKQIEN